MVRSSLAIAVLLVLGAAALIGIAPVFLKLTVDAFTYDATNLNPVHILLIVTYATAHWLARASEELRWLGYGRADQRLERLLSLRLFEHLMALPLRFHLDRNLGALTQILTNGILGYRLVLQHLLFTILPITIQLVTMSMIVILLGHTEFPMILAASIICYAAAFRMGMISVSGPSRVVSAAQVDANALITDSILNYETVAHCNAGLTVRQRVNRALLRTERACMSLYSARVRNGFLVAT